jgi:hypothetical protein
MEPQKELDFISWFAEIYTDLRQGLVFDNIAILMRQNVCSNGCQRYIPPLMTGTGHPGNTWMGQGKS